VLLSHRHRTTVVAGVLLLSTAACVQPGPPGVAINKLQADIVFGVKDVVDAPAVAPPNLASVTPTQAVEIIQDQAADPEKVLTIPKVTPIRRAPAAVAAVECPAAALTAFPAKTADTQVDGVPAEGLYKFKRTLEVKSPAGEVTRSEGYEQRAVRRVTPNPTKAYEFTYQVVQPNYVSNNFTITQFRVNSNPAVVRSVNQPPQTVGVVPVPGVEQVITPPTDEPGIFVDSITTQSAPDDAGTTFTPVPPVKYLPLDEGIVRGGQTFDSVGISTSSLGVLRHTGTVLRKTRVDACGEVVEGWLVESDQTSSDSSASRKYFYNVATQYGALFIAENSIQTLSDGTTITIDLSLAKLTPDPLPETLK
jgi:hypothetical protein